MQTAREIVAAIGPGSRVTVVGLGRSGFAAVRLLKKMGAEVAVSEGGPAEKIASEILAWLNAHGVKLECAGHSPDYFAGRDLVVVSPGVPLDLPVLLTAKSAGIPVLGEMALACALVSTPIIAITGTNGKSTVTELVGEMFKAAGRPPFVGGNLGTPLCEYLLGQDECEVLILEVSSFQLDTAFGFSPDVAVLLNISPDHLDRYVNYEAYAASKLSIFAEQKPIGIAILNGDDPELMARIAKYPVPGRRYFYGQEVSEPGLGATVVGTVVRVSLRRGMPVEEYSLAQSNLAQEPNIHNGAAAILAARLLGCPAEAVRRALSEFQLLKHRLALVAEINGVQYFDDSKATNIGAAAAALQGMSRPVFLIGGGRDKGGDYGLLHQIVRDKVKLLILIGEAREKMAASFAGVTKIKLAESLEEAVAIAASLAKEGEAVLLAPACASFDMFNSYSHRGQVFREAVGALVNLEEERREP